MAKFIIHGGRKLNGEVEISGAKNAALKMLAATVLTPEICILDNVPRIADVEVMIKILESIGAKIQWLAPHSLQINPSKINSYRPNPLLMQKMRASVVLAGPLLARFGRVEIAQPGGCVIGVRPVHEHWLALQKLGVDVSEAKDKVVLRAKKLVGNKIVLDSMSVTGTENVLMAAVMAAGETEIRLAAVEPEVQDLAHFLKKMGAKIKGEKTHVISVTGVRNLKSARHRVIPDRIEIGTFVIAAVTTGGKVIIKNIIPDHLDIFFNRLEKSGVNYKCVNHRDKYCDLLIEPPHHFHPIKIDTRPYPGFPTDLQAPTSVLMTQLPKTSKIFETIFENRLKYLQELQKMGAKVKIIDTHTAEISGPTRLNGAKITSYDLRAGATLILAGLIAKGKTEISNIETIDRGYERIEYKLSQLGANIQRVQ